MKKQNSLRVQASLVLLPLLAISAIAQELAPAATTPVSSPVLMPPATVAESKTIAATGQAAADGKFLYVFIFENEDESTRNARTVFDEFAAANPATVQSFIVNRTDATEFAFITQNRLAGAPLPLVLVIAPNGAMTGRYSGQNIAAKSLLGGLVSPAKLQYLKSLQDRRLVFICIQNKATTANAAAMAGVMDFKADTRYAAITDVVALDPANPKEQSFLEELKVKPDAKEATTLLFAPPGSIIRQKSGASTADDWSSALIAASSYSIGCGSSGGCGPKGCK